MKSKIPLYIILCVLILVILFDAISVFRKPETIINTKIDTLLVTRVDTFVQIKPEYKYKRIIDTLVVYATKDSIIYLPIEQKYYGKPDSYDCWISGINTNLDSIRVYNKTIDHYITNTITEKIYPRKLDLYMQLGGYMIDKDVVPFIGLDLAIPNGLKVGANVGLFDNKPIYGINVGYKINK